MRTKQQKSINIYFSAALSMVQNAGKYDICNVYFINYM